MAFDFFLSDMIVAQHLRDCRRAERALSLAADAHNVAVGAPGVHPHFAEVTDHAPTALRQIQVMNPRRKVVFPIDFVTLVHAGLCLFDRPIRYNAFKVVFAAKSIGYCPSISSNPRMNSLIYRSCHNGIIESGDYWNQQGLEHQHSCTRSSTELFDSTADLNASRSTKDEIFSRLVSSRFVY